MPWDGTQLCVADIAEDGTLGTHRVVAGGPAEAVCQVEWDGPDTLVALTDPGGWWNLFRIDPTGEQAPVNVAPVEADLGGPLWRIGARWFAVLGGGRYAVVRHGRLALADAATGTIVDMAVDLPVWGDLAAADGVIAGIAGSATRDHAVVSLDLADNTLTELTGQPDGMPDPAYLPQPVERTFSDPAGRSVPAYVYLPTNPDFAGPDGERPPLLVFVHGGPTGSFAPVFSPSIAYFTSRGFAVTGVNYGGSTGYGREFRERLRDQWGVVDVVDCAAVAEALAAEGTVDAARMAVRGGSAGGWTSAASLTSVHTYRCGTVMYPILDATGWTAEGGQTHDFESRYLEGLIGSLPEHADRYAERSPARHADALAGPVLMLQGLDDQICPPVQADEFIAGLAGTGIPHAYLTFEGEQHGFRRAESIQTALEAELSFYGQVFGFTTPGVPVLALRS
jgi:dipeptidyl aminopeptidase/acylaminoacyl peptidase